ncbi:phytanoyl-CoA dioxygenase family protein [Paenibacillus agricola]|uniref:Phytanoyl-CoA dioxygenase family protein n=1 Tax=Paenibacillus agricola TaxID=2716264 RepID=A0ABX0J0Z1_9BACL|nr:phytanoyl-CoA dioxygenase family protein [Paenibacillus agricola]NHN29915.1 phytanoyl-CoA dioxygenase family protein [Paenibacillus agricola]
MITAEQVQFYHDNGYLLVKGVYNKEEVEMFRGSVDTFLKRAAASKFDRSHAWQGDYMPPEELKKLVLKGFHDVQYHDAQFSRMITQLNLVGIFAKLIGDNVQLHHTKMMVKPPEKGAAFPMHQDYPYFPHTKHSMMLASIHLDQTNEENGCLHVIPGSHKLGPLPHIGSYYLNHKEYPIASGIPCLAEAGDVLFFNYLTIHGSPINRSDRTRRNILVQVRDPEDLPTNDKHVNWGQGLMLNGINPVFRNYKYEGKLANDETMEL